MDLKTYLSDRGISYDRFSKQIGCTANYIYMVCAKRKTPGKFICIQITQATGGEVKMEDLRGKND